MPYCPKCKDGFQDWVKECPDCHVELVNELPPELEEDDLDKKSVLNKRLTDIAES
jgi:hypothetical protein